VSCIYASHLDVRQSLPYTTVGMATSYNITAVSLASSSLGSSSIILRCLKSSSKV